MYLDEDVTLDLRLNYLNNIVDKFVIVESKFTHSGKKRELLFDIKKFKNFKDKIIYLVLDHEPPGIEKISKHDNKDKKNSKYILNGMKRDFYQSYLSRLLQTNFQVLHLIPCKKFCL